MEQERESDFRSSLRSMYVDLEDRWAPSGSVRLDGALERRRFPPWLLVLVTLIGSFLFFQIVGAIAMVALLVIQGLDLNDMADFEALMMESTDLLLIGNTIGQVFALAIPVWLLVFLHTRYNLSFLRFRSASLPLMGLSVIGLAVMIPVSWWLGSINQMLPLPDWLQQLEDSQVDLIEQVFVQDLSLVFLIATMALTPAICEEIVFRGYLQRQLERSAGVIWGIVITGIIFGCFHLRLSQVLPLSVIGIYLAYLTWRTGSIWPAIIVHFANNAFTIVLGKYLLSRTDMDMESLESMSIPIPIVLACVVLFSGVLYIMHLLATSQLEELDEARSDITPGNTLASTEGEHQPGTIASP